MVDSFQSDGEFNDSVLCSIIYSLFITVIFVLLELDYFKCKYKKFPKQFMLGTGSSAYQIEGAWNNEGKYLHRYFKL